ncbi:hypothetical protein BDV25DRAFT_147647 [Aspergillus avenaceus]|uniref:Uncharacterized protein n=1 Tax=Aspergillus avenaceus TaxID=36643 RepID=A0A5N6U6X5_ASPAV|nr:hypothetical protein BDV25DRAFT_147647 [Aspergillus avenaceus]
MKEKGRIRDNPYPKKVKLGIWSVPPNPGPAVLFILSLEWRSAVPSRRNQGTLLTYYYAVLFLFINYFFFSLSTVLP